jgi:hypothetical protein
LTGQFAPRFILRLGGELTLLRAATIRRLRSQIFASQWQLSCNVSAGITWRTRNSMLLLQAVSATKEARVSPQTIVPREVHHQFTTALRSDFLCHTSRSFLREIERHTRSTTLMERMTAARTMTWYVPSPSSAIGKRNDAEPEVMNLAGRLQRHSRIEEAWTPPRTVLLRRSPMQTQETQFIEAPAMSFPARPQAVNSQWTIPAVQTGININQITDEVVRKLDSRLIAARERYGKI